VDFLPLAAPALPLDEAGKYVAGAYIVFLVLIVVYVAIMAAKLQRIERELRELAGFAEQRNGNAPEVQREEVSA
jgi:type II secretory pathway component PulM